MTNTSRAVICPDNLWTTVVALVGASGLALAETEGKPGQMPRYDIQAVDVRRRDGLTPREVEVLRGMADGRRNGEIAKSLFLSEDTIKTHARHLFKKIGARDRAHAVAIAYRTGIIGGAR